MQSYINHENLRRYRKLIAISEGDPCRNEARHQTLVRLLAEEEAKEKEPNNEETRVIGVALISVVAVDSSMNLTACRSLRKIVS